MHSSLSFALLGATTVLNGEGEDVMGQVCLSLNPFELGIIDEMLDSVRASPWELSRTNISPLLSLLLGATILGNRLGRRPASDQLGSPDPSGPRLSPVDSWIHTHTPIPFLLFLYDKFILWVLMLITMWPGTQAHVWLILSLASFVDDVVCEWDIDRGWVQSRLLTGWMMMLWGRVWVNPNQHTNAIYSQT